LIKSRGKINVQSRYPFITYRAINNLYR